MYSQLLGHSLYCNQLWCDLGGVFSFLHNVYSSFVYRPIKAAYASASHRPGNHSVILATGLSMLCTAYTDS